MLLADAYKGGWRPHTWRGCDLHICEKKKQWWGFVPACALIFRVLGSNAALWRFVTGLRATLNMPLKGQPKAPFAWPERGFFDGLRPTQVKK